MRLVQLAALAFFVGSCLMILVLVIRRSFLARGAGRREALVARLRPTALALVEGDATQPVPDFQGMEAEVFASLLGGYARLLSGEARERIAAYFEASGGVDEQLRRLRSRRAWKRASAAFTLGDMCSLRAAPSLIRALDDQARDVRMAVTRSLGRLGALDAIEPLISASLAGRVPRAVTGLALLDLGPTAVPRLLELTESPEPAVRAGAVELVGLLGNAGDARPVLDRLRDPAATVRTASADALGRLGPGNPGTRSCARSTTVCPPYRRRRRRPWVRRVGVGRPRHCSLSRAATGSSRLAPPPRHLPESILPSCCRSRLSRASARICGRRATS